MRALVAGTERLFAVLCGFGAMLNVGSAIEGLSPVPVALGLALALALASGWLASLAARLDRRAARERRRQLAVRQLRLERRRAASALAAARAETAGLRVA